jgi:hypothetical protein
MERKVLTQYKKLPAEVKKALKNQYPLGFDDVLTTIKMISNGESISALVYRFKDTLYLIKYTRKKRKNIRLYSEEIEDEEYESEDESNTATGGE